MKNKKARLAFEMLEKEMEVLSKESQNLYMGGLAFKNYTELIEFVSKYGVTDEIANKRYVMLDGSAFLHESASPINTVIVTNSRGEGVLEALRSLGSSSSSVDDNFVLPSTGIEPEYLIQNSGIGKLTTGNYTSANPKIFEVNINYGNDISIELRDAIRSAASKMNSLGTVEVGGKFYKLKISLTSYNTTTLARFNSPMGYGVINEQNNMPKTSSGEELLGNATKVSAYIDTAMHNTKGLSLDKTVQHEILHMMGFKGNYGKDNEHQLGPDTIMWPFNSPFSPNTMTQNDLEMLIKARFGSGANTGSTGGADDNTEVPHIAYDWGSSGLISTGYDDNGVYWENYYIYEENGPYDAGDAPWGHAHLNYSTGYNYLTEDDGSTGMEFGIIGSSGFFASGHHEEYGEYKVFYTVETDGPYGTNDGPLGDVPFRYSTGIYYLDGIGRG